MPSGGDEGEPLAEDRSIVTGEPQEEIAAPSRGSGVGAVLRETRESRGVDLDGVARALRIRQPYLRAIEEGRYQDLPGAAYAHGFVRSYAEFLGLDSAEILRRYKEESGGGSSRTELIFPAPVSEGGIPAAVLIGLAIIAAAIIYGVWYFYQWRHSADAEAVSVLPDRLAALMHAPGGEDTVAPTVSSTSPTTVAPSGAAAATPDKTAPTPAAAAPAPPASSPSSPSPAPSPTATAAPTATPAAKPATIAAAPAPAPAPMPAAVQIASASSAKPMTPSPAPDAAPAPAPAQPVASTAESAQSDTSSSGPPPAPDLTSQPSRVVLRAIDDCWIEIRDGSGAIVTSRLLHKGDSYPVPPRPGLTLTAGNAGALVLLLDGNQMPPLGRTGMVRHDVRLDPDRFGTPAAAVVGGTND